MEIRVLKYFIEVARTGSLTRAADILHITQPSLSKQIKLLEGELGQKLFRRGQYKMILTEVGESFLPRAIEIVDLSDLALSEYISKKKDISGDLSIAFADGSFSGNVVDVINSFRNAYPNVRLLFYSGGLEYVSSLTQKNITDIACNYYGNAPEGLNSVKTDQIRRSGLVMRRDDMLATYTDIPEDIYSKLPMIMPRGVLLDENGDDLAIQVDREKVVALVEEPFTFLSLLQNSGAYIFCLEPTAEVLSRYDIIFRPVRPSRTSNLYFVQNDRKTPTEVMTAFMDYVGQFYKTKTQQL